MVTSRKLNLTRDQLATFLKDQQQIRQFELLFQTVDDLEVITGTDFEFQADNAAASANSALAQIDTLNQIVAGLQLAPPPRELKRTRFGFFYGTTTQAATVINTATGITFNNTSLSFGVALGSPTSRVIVDTEGIYSFTATFQLDKTTVGAGDFFIWFRLNGTNVADSARQIRVQSNTAEICSSINYVLNLKSTDFVELMFSVSDLTVVLVAVPAAAPAPSIPAITLSVNAIGGLT